MRELGGEAYLRLLEFRPDGKTVRVKVYSSLCEPHTLESGHSFMITLN